MPSSTEKQRRFFYAVKEAKEGKKSIGKQAKKAAMTMSKKSIEDFLKLKKR